MKYIKCGTQEEAEQIVQSFKQKGKSAYWIEYCAGNIEVRVW